MILLLSNERDLTTDYIVRELRRRELSYFRLNSERLASAHVRFDPCGGAGGWSIDFPKRRLRLSEVTAGYFRRPAVPTVQRNVTEPSLARYCVDEWLAALHAIYAAVGCRWLNSPDRIEAAENKAAQLALARAVGFDVPETLITNEPAAVRGFLEGGNVIAKPFRSGLLDASSALEQDRVIFTTRLSSLAWSAESIEAAPVIYQREVPKQYDIRATVVGDKVFAAQIASQDREETSIDWRRGAHADLPHATHALPAEVKRRCAELVQRQRLRFAAIDLILDRDDRYWFLEANPNGQWAWIETRTGLPIAAAIVDELVAISRTSA